MTESDSNAKDAEFDAYAQDYDAQLDRGLKLTGESKEFFAVERVRWLKRRLQQHQAAMASVFDFGCGTGSSLPPLREVIGVAQYLGFDPSAGSIDEARKQPAATGDYRFTDDEGDIPAGDFDIAFTNGVFHHILPEHRDAACHTVWRALRPGGYFAFWENNRWNPMVHYVMSRVAFDRDAQMLFPFQARSLLRRNGFDCERTDSRFVFPSQLAFLRALEPALCKLPVGGQYLILARKPLTA